MAVFHSRRELRRGDGGSRRRVRPPLVRRSPPFTRDVVHERREVVHRPHASIDRVRVLALDPREGGHGIDRARGGGGGVVVVVVVAATAPERGLRPHRPLADARAVHRAHADRVTPLSKFHDPVRRRLDLERPLVPHPGEPPDAREGVAAAAAAATASTGFHFERVRRARVRARADEEVHAHL